MRPRSPFFGASKQDLKTYRACAQKVESWKKAAAAGNFYQLDEWADAPDDSRLFHGHLIMKAFVLRGWNQLDKTPDMHSLREADRLSRLRHLHPQLYELEMLRKEVSALRDDLAASRNVVLKALPPGKMVPKVPLSAQE